jgi:2-keto-4-pentenoate hydratase/2-oxohepta-3-ene-1,7-dioic acid hydratase in catechol pathway
VVDIQAGAAVIEEHAPDTVIGILEGGEDALSMVRRVEQAARDGSAPVMPMDEIVLLPAIPAPPTLYLLAANYQSHITESGAPPVDKATITPRPFIKPGTAVIGTGAPIVIPADSETLDYEIEIAAVIGTGGRMISLEDAPSLIAGYVVFNDISARSLKIAEGRVERNGDWFFDWLLGKWCDSFAVVGPYLVTSDEIEDPGGLDMSLWVNGELRQHSDAGEMIFTVPETIAFLSRFVTLRPGDLICMGTPGGVGATTDTYLKAGDVVKGTIEHLGTIENTVTAVDSPQ